MNNHKNITCICNTCVSSDGMKICDSDSAKEVQEFLKNLYHQMIFYATICWRLTSVNLITVGSALYEVSHKNVSNIGSAHSKRNKMDILTHNIKFCERKLNGFNLYWLLPMTLKHLQVPFCNGNLFLQLKLAILPELIVEQTWKSNSKCTSCIKQKNKAQSLLINNFSMFIIDEKDIERFSSHKVQTNSRSSTPTTAITYKSFLSVTSMDVYKRICLVISGITNSSLASSANMALTATPYGSWILVHRIL